MNILILYFYSINSLELTIMSILINKTHAIELMSKMRVVLTSLSIILKKTLSIFYLINKISF
jgi:hypothetical protein